MQSERKFQHMLKFLFRFLRSLLKDFYAIPSQHVVEWTISTNSILTVNFGLPFSSFLCLFLLHSILNFLLAIFWRENSNFSRGIKDFIIVLVNFIFVWVKISPENDTKGKFWFCEGNLSFLRLLLICQHVEEVSHEFLFLSSSLWRIYWKPKRTFPCLKKWQL